MLRSPSRSADVVLEPWLFAHRVHSHSHGCRRFTQGGIIDVLYLLIPLSVVLVFLIGVVFWWSLRSGQFDDLEGPAHRILQDDDDPKGS